MDLKTVMMPMTMKVDGIKIKDYVSIEPANIVDNLPPDTAGASDLAIASGAKVSSTNLASNNKKRTFFWTNTRKGVEGIINIRGNQSEDMGQRVDWGIACVRPLICVKKSALENNNINFNISKSISGFERVTIDGFSFPQTVVEEPLASELEGFYSPSINFPYTTVFNKTGANKGEVCEYNGVLYMRFAAPTPYNENCYSNGKRATSNPSWFKFEPIVWILRIKDGDDMYLCSEDGLIGNINYHNKIVKNSDLWQNSLIRSYLNGLDLEESIKSGNGKRGKMTGINFNFENEGFIDTLQMAFDFSMKEGTKDIPKLLPINAKHLQKKVEVSGVKAGERDDEEPSQPGVQEKQTPTSSGLGDTTSQSVINSTYQTRVKLKKILQVPQSPNMTLKTPIQSLLQKSKSKLVKWTKMTMGIGVLR